MPVAEWLWANPVVAREWARSQRLPSRRRTLARGVGQAAMLALWGCAAHWLSREERSPWEARALLLGLCLLYLAAVFVLVPGPAAAAIAGERERRTWEALRLTALHPAQVVLGKLLARLGPAVGVLVLLSPPLLMGIHAARLPVSHLPLLLVVLLATPFPVAAGALWLSARCRRARTAVALAYALTALVSLAELVGPPVRFLRGENPVWYLSPAWQAAILCLAEPSRSPRVRPLLPEWAWFLLACAVLTGLALTLLTRRVAAEG